MKPTLEAWDKIISESEQRVLLSLLARGVRLDRAREICHETWARLYEQYSLGRLDRLALPGIAIVQAGFIAAQDGRRANPVPLRARLEPHFPSPEEQIASRELLERAARALERCSPRAQEIFQVVYNNPETPHAELARRLGLSLQRLRQTLCEVRARIRRALAEDSHD